MRSIFDEKLMDLHHDLLQLGRMVNEAIYKSIKAFKMQDIELAEKIVSYDLQINKKENEIDSKCYEVIALEQPNTRDLRRIISVMRTTTDLERMGDHARNIAKVTIHIQGNQGEQELEDKIVQMGEKINEMCSEMLDAFIQNDLTQARKIAERDAEIDEEYQEVRRMTIKRMQENPLVVSAGADYSFVGMHLERIGDYIKNIAEWIIYLNTGEIIDFE